MVPALISYIDAIQKLASIFTELARNTTDIEDRLDKIKEFKESDEAKRAKKLYLKMKKVSKELDNQLIGTVHIFNIAATDFEAIN